MARVKKSALMECISANSNTEALYGYHVTVLSNLARGYDKYSRTYSKSSIPESTYPTQFYLLNIEDLPIGIEKGRRLLKKVNLPGNQLIILETRVDSKCVRPNLRNGLGYYIECNDIKVENIYTLDAQDCLVQAYIEETLAHSIDLLYPTKTVYGDLRPRTISILPVARGCQAKCPFCFSTASVSAERWKNALSLDRIDAVIRQARQRGAERLVITGGGEPGLLPDAQIEQIIRAASRMFSNVVMISNGYKWSSMAAGERTRILNRLANAGLKTLAISCHHSDRATNAELMQLDTSVENLLMDKESVGMQNSSLNLRLICVLQKGGVACEQELVRYIDWAACHGVQEICFKELYVSTSLESVYHSNAANRWSRDHQVPLDLVTDYLDRLAWKKVCELPWGAPIYAGKWNDHHMQIAAYTEPSLFWELSHGICRSWNLIADGTCLASLEDKNSEVAVV